MSQIIFRSLDKDRNPVEVQTGWDKPLQYVHFTVFSVPGDDVIYSELDFPNAFSMTVQNVIEKLNTLGIEYPEILPTMLTDHKMRNAGNERVVLVPTERGRFILGERAPIDEEASK